MNAETTRRRGGGGCIGARVWRANRRRTGAIVIEAGTQAVEVPTSTPRTTHSRQRQRHPRAYPRHITAAEGEDGPLALNPRRVILIPISET